MREKRPVFGLTVKITLLLAVLLALVVAGLSALVLAGIRDDQRERLEANFAQRSEAAELRLRQELLTGTDLAPEAYLQENGQRLAVDLGAQSGMPVTLYDADGAVVGTSLPFQPRADAGDALAHTALGHSAYITQGSSLLYLAPLYSEENRIGTIQFHASLAEQQAFYEEIRKLFLVAGAGMLAAGFAAVFLLVRRQVGVIRRMNEEAKAIGQGRYPAAPSSRRRDELGQLARGIYEMSGSIAASVGALNEEKRKLQETARQLRELEQQQKRFIGNISHELKTPLTSILAYADLLEMYGDDPALLSEASGVIRSEAQRLLSLVERALQLSAMDVYDFETRGQQVELTPLLEHALSRIKAKAEAKEIEVTAELRGGSAWADPDNVMHIMLNLLDNAIKYNRPGGSIRLSVREPEDLSSPAALPDSAGERSGGLAASGPAETADPTARPDSANLLISTFWMVEVADTGPGIPPEARELIFEPFYTVSGDRSRTSGGTGLGLPLARSLARKQGGELLLAESGASGSVFRLFLPKERPAENGVGGGPESD